MDAYQLFIVLLALYLGVLIAIGWYFTKRQKTVTDFWLAGRRIGTIGVGFSSAASWLTTGGILAVIGFFMLLGMGSIWGFVAPNILALLIIAMFVKKIKSLPTITQPELLEQRYSSAIRAPVGIIITIVMILFAVADIKGFTMVLQVFYGLNPVYAALLVALAVSVYVILGGLHAVVWTDVMQFMFLMLVTLVIAVFSVGAATGGAGAPADAAELFSSVPSNWWNPLSIGIPMILIYIIAIIPGWITEQDPWQKVWAAKDSKSSRNGLLLGSVLITIVFAACAIIAIALSSIYPEIPASFEEIGMGAMAQAEPAMLMFINSYFSPMVISVLSIGLVAAAMSSADTFATSGASSLSRDVYQRFIKPDATMKEMLTVNRICVLIIVAAATIGSFLIDGIIAAIHIATFIASASYFFPLMGGLYWKRATKEGALAGLIVGGVSQISLIVYDLYMTPPLSTPYLESIHPILMNHGIIVGMLLSGVAFFGVSLATKPSSSINLAPFFEDEAENLAADEAKAVDENDPDFQTFLTTIQEQAVGERAHLHVKMECSASINWKRFVDVLRNNYPAWVTSAGIDSIYRLVQADMLACVSITRGNNDKEIWFASEPNVSEMEIHKKELFVAYNEVSKALESIGLFISIPEKD
ncbi:sodium:solute symporter family protein [Methanohalophilus sp.]|uniref:sodium:solute symporter family protein n=1 Tax=Methanohalophilus sp. TaxID=1966352 RepID=UPI002638229A|nr:sodium:solute symporter family protein [Methanohalophilus sp.]MDK2891908.1 solute:Na+ symporter, family [Methanohalophilus sp.]